MEWINAIFMDSSSTQFVGFKCRNNLKRKTKEKNTKTQNSQ